MKKTRKFKRHVVIAVDAIKDIFDNEQSNGHTTNKMAAHFGISRNVLQQGFKQLHGINIRQYKLQQRMDLSKKLLAEGKDIKEVALILHYASPSAFTTAFKKYYGITPTESLDILYRQKWATAHKIVISSAK